MTDPRYIEALKLGRSGYPNAEIVATFPHIQAEVLWCPTWKQHILFQHGHAEHIADKATTTSLLTHLTEKENLAILSIKALQPSQPEASCPHHSPAEPALA